MSKHFTSVLRVEQPDKEAEERLGVSTQDNTASLQPHPLSPSQLTYQFDHVYTGAEGSSELYKSSVKEVVEGTLLGYHGTVILFGVKGSGLSDLVGRPSSGLVQKAALHICKCLRKSKESNSQHATNLVVLCSYVMVVDEDVHDLLSDGPVGATTGSPDPAAHVSSVRIENGVVIGAKTHPVKSSAKVQSLLKRGMESEREILARYGRTPEQGLHHSAFSLSVEYAQFGTMNAPVSGNLSFVLVGAADPLTSAGSYETQPGQYPPSVGSIFGFASVLNVLTADDCSDLSQSMQGGRLMCADFERFALIRLLKEALGGNSKTLLVALVPSSYPTGLRSEVSEVLSLSSRARTIQNHPNKRIFAEKALMTAYMKELYKKYGGIQESPSEMPTSSANGQKPPSEKYAHTRLHMHKTARNAQSTLIHITSYTSPHTHHLIHITSYTSPHTHHLIHITSYTSPHTHHLIHINTYTSPHTHHYIHIHTVHMSLTCSCIKIHLKILQFSFVAPPYLPCPSYLLSSSPVPLISSPPLSLLSPLLPCPSYLLSSSPVPLISSPPLSLLSPLLPCPSYLLSSSLVPLISSPPLSLLSPLLLPCPSYLLSSPVPLISSPPPLSLLSPFLLPCPSYLLSSSLSL